MKLVHILVEGQTLEYQLHVASNQGDPQTNDKPKKDPVCVFCKGTHKPNSCTTITSPKIHLTIVKSAGLCYNCLARHKVSQCNSKFNCRECHKKHHTSLCHAFNTNTTSSQEDIPPDQTLTTLIPTPLPVSYTSVCLLKTAIADISAGTITIEGHILFNEGAQHSFIIQELADKLQLKPTGHENVSVASFARSLLSSATFNLRSWASNSPHLMNTAVEHNVAEVNNPIKVLGLWWDIQHDLLYPLPKPNTTTYADAMIKREILKWISSIFDSLGLITPVTISAKLFLQQLWQKQLAWDTELSEDLCSAWEGISHNM